MNVKKANLKNEIVKAISQRGKMTRPELIEETSTRAASVIGAVSDLKTAGILIEPERKTKKTGRKAPEIYLNPDYCWLGGIDFQVDQTLGVICDLHGNIRFQAQIESGPRKTSEDAKMEIRKLVNELRSLAGNDWNLVKGICFADPGLVDIDSGESLRAVNVPVWANIKTVSWLEHICDMPAYILPETMARTYMEYFRRLPDPPSSMFLLNTGKGIGGGFIKNGEMFFGDTGKGMEIGHLVMNSEGPICQCGNRGCLEALAGEDGIRKKVEEALKNGVATALAGAPFSIDHFMDCLKRDRPAQIIASEICEYMAKALEVVVTLLNPSHIVVTGSLTGLECILSETILRSLRLNCLHGAVEELKLEYSTLEPYDTARGACLYIREKLLLAAIG
jgi:predicted NBD/HSP70 family sugar kinase